jgi:hypothetical protein
MSTAEEVSFRNLTETGASRVVKPITSLPIAQDYGAAMLTNEAMLDLSGLVLGLRNETKR